MMTTNERHVEVLVLDGCPHVDAAIARVREAVATTTMHAKVSLVHIESDEHAKRLRFLGSP
jgi:hypothetical protein